MGQWATSRASVQRAVDDWIFRALGYVDGPERDATPTDPASQPLTRQLDAASVSEREVMQADDSRW